jgi:hypothetical protein
MASNRFRCLGELKRLEVIRVAVENAPTDGACVRLSC